MTTSRTASADQLAASLRDHRCDALDPCDPCKSARSEVVAARHAARVAAVVASQPVKVSAR